jgi:hypothetical protein
MERPKRSERVVEFRIVDDACMATMTLVAVQEYLRSYYERLDREFVDGVVVERAKTTFLHSKVQGLLCLPFGLLGRSWRWRSMSL